MKLLVAIASTAVLSAGTAYADCSYPTPPDHLPNGNTATLQEMVEGQKAVKQYDKDINAYVACIQLEKSDAVSKLAPKPGEKPTEFAARLLEEIRTIPQRFRQSCLPPPPPDVFVIPVHQHFRHSHSAKIRGPR